MVVRIHDTFYDAKATLLSDDDIKEIRESRGRIPNASKKMADKFHIGPKRVYEIWDNKERLQQGIILFSSNQTRQTLEVVSEVSSIPLPATEIPKKNGRKKKVKIDEKPVTEASSMGGKITKMMWPLPLIICLIHPEKTGWILFLKI